jgi:hypothetical protein
MCNECSGYARYRSCPCCDAGYDPVRPTPPPANPQLYDVVSVKRRTFIAFTMTPLFLLLWAANVGYTVIVDGDEITLRDAQGRDCYYCWPQHEDTMVDFDRSAAVDMATWM